MVEGASEQGRVALRCLDQPGIDELDDIASREGSADLLAGQMSLRHGALAMKNELALQEVLELNVEWDGNDIARGDCLQKRGAAFDRRLSFMGSRQLL